MAMGQAQWLAMEGMDHSKMATWVQGFNGAGYEA